MKFNRVFMIFSIVLGMFIPFAGGQTQDAALAGVKITLDAGHGGEETGAVGLGGLMEKDVNRAVVDELKNLLVASGAEVRETRPGDESVSLPERTRFHKEWGADLFVSVHHNANAELDRSVNRSEVYYHYRDRKGPSRDLAVETVRRLSQKFQLPGSEAKVVHAYHVLRENHVPSILGEAGYLSSPEGEAMFADPDVIRLEAEAYFEAIVDFFAKGRPEIRWVGALTERVRGQWERIDHLDFAFEECPVFVVEIRDEKRNVDPDGLRAWIDGVPADLRFDPESGLLRFTSKFPLPSGRYPFRVVAQNTAGRYGVAIEKEFTIQSQPVVVLLEAKSEGIPNAPGAQARAIVRVWDQHGYPVIADGIPVEFVLYGGEIVRSDFRLKEGFALAHFQPLSDTVEVGVRVGEAVTRQIVRFTEPVHQLHGYLWNQTTGQPISEARVELNDGGWTRTDRQGWFFFLLEQPETVQVRMSSDGYWPVLQREIHFQEQVAKIEARLQPLFGGVLQGRRLILDPEFGGRESGQVSETGLRAADVNLRAAFLAQGLLEASGAEVELTREEDTTMSDQDRTRFGLAREFDWFITLRHAEPRPGHDEPEDLNLSRAFAKWGDARRLAQLFPIQMQEVLGTPGSDLANCSKWEVMHASDKFQAVGLSPLFMTAPGAAERLESQAVLRKEAQALLYGLVLYYSFADLNGDLPDLPDGPASLDRRLREETGEIQGTVFDKHTGRPLSDVLVGVEDILWTATEDDGKFSWKYLDPGRYSIRFKKIGYHSEVIPVELHQGTIQQLDVQLGAVN